MKRLPVLPLLACVAWGCGVEFSAPLVGTAAEFRASVSLVDSLPLGEARLSGLLWPGFDQYGAVRTLADASFQLLGRTIAPFAGPLTQEPGGIPYSDQWSFDADAPIGAVELRAPEVPGTLETAPVLRLVPPWRTGPAALTAVAGSTLSLPLAIQPQPGDTIREFWHLDLTRYDGQYVSQLDATGPTPATIEVPWAMLAGLGERGLVRLTTWQSVATPAGRGYSATLALTTRHVWLVTVQP